MCLLIPYRRSTLPLWPRGRGTAESTWEGARRWSCTLTPPSSTTPPPTRGPSNSTTHSLTQSQSWGDLLRSIKWRVVSSCYIVVSIMQCTVRYYLSTKYKFSATLKSVYSRLVVVKNACRSIDGKMWSGDWASVGRILIMLMGQDSIIILSCSLYSSGEQSRIDHLVLVVHGIGAHHDLSFRSLVDCGKF